MHNKELLGYSVYFKESKEAKAFFVKIDPDFSAELNGDEKEVLLLGTEPLLKDEYFYFFRKEKAKAKVEISKVYFIQSLFCRD